MTLSELHVRMSSAEFAEWQAYYVLESFGEDWKQTSYLCSMIGNAAGGKGHGRAYKPSEFMPVKVPLWARVKQTAGQILEILKGIAEGRK